MNTILQINEQAILNGGGLSANWVLIGMTALAFILFGRVLWKIERNLEKVCDTVADHNTRVKIAERDIEELRDDINRIL